MTRIAIVYHSRQGNTQSLAHAIATGARKVDGVTADVLPAASLLPEPDRLVAYDAFVWGSPTYLGGVSGPFKSFMDATGGLWRTQRLRGKLAAGFTVSALPSGDKQTTLLSMLTFSMQHGMVWVGNAFLPGRGGEGSPPADVNRLGSWTGLLAQAGHTQGAALDAGDLHSAELFGGHVARTAVRRCFSTAEAS